MSGYAVNNDGSGWRAVNSEADVDPAVETYSATQPSKGAAQQWAEYQGEARAALADTDTTMHCIAEGVALGATSWTATDVVALVQYRQTLRAILLQAQPGTIPSALPTRPPYPAGT